MTSIQDPQTLRKLVLAGIVGLMVGGAVLDVATGSFAVFGLSMLRFVCPVGFLEVSLATRSIVWTALPYTLLALGAILLVGRFPCGWLCPMYKFKQWVDSVVPVGQLQSLSSRLPVRASWRDGVAVLAGILGVSAVTGFPAYCILCPIGIISRNLISLGTHATVHPDLLLVPMYPLILGIFVDWQRVCPVGSIGGIANQVAPLRTPRPDTDVCIECGSCQAACPEDIDIMDPDVDMGACTQCLRCTSNCPEDALGLFRPAPEEEPADSNV